MNAPRDLPETGAPRSVDLSNCDREPIHIPGLIQPHGALLALDAELRVAYASDNLAELLPGAPALGEVLTPAHFEDAAVYALLTQVAALAPVDVLQERHALIEAGGRAFDLLVHQSHAWVMAEFELRQSSAGRYDEGAALYAVVKRFRQQPDVLGLLQEAVRAVRELTGFDRVMAYCFRADDSGDVVAEERVDALEPYLGQRFPASDIPAQARRLYTENTMRLIADVGSAPVPVRAAPGVGQPLDMSHGVLRSVSPIHIEYLQNIGVGASMSLSIVLGGRLWGMLACHHRTPRQVPYAMRAVCDVLAHLLAAHVRAHLTAEQAQEERLHERLRARVLDQVQYAVQPAQVLMAEAAEIARVFRADAVLATNHAGLHCHGDVPVTLRSHLLRWLTEQELAGEPVLVTSSIADMAPGLREHLSGWAGLLAISYQPRAQAALVLLRREQTETIDWGHHPAKATVIGPLGPRLTPPGSFELWRETVRHRAEPWTAMQVAAMGQLRADLSRIVVTRMAELERQRAAVASVLDDSGRQTGLPDDAGRMERLLRQGLEFGLLRQGRMALARQPLDVAALVAGRLEAAQRRHGGIAAFLERPGKPPHHTPVNVSGDRVRLEQLVDNLLDNAAQHGAVGEALVIRVDVVDAFAVIEVSNISPPMDPQMVTALFDPLVSPAVVDASSGLGYGLYISQAVAVAHGGDLAYTYDDPFVTMTARLPLALP
ncbi:GAF domain-containing protein [Ottowia testudinis]|uniref:GAF domain-containing protein n=1 Tax=Ottowia testudinis TaxID=2816950 RepID=A0A975CGN1_9BURK|nr:GAF domain-containing protein [Ottowia testudinis]QTD45850.1 GAF domain-containing protein [Ottowia testudinis]